MIHGEITMENLIFEMNGLKFAENKSFKECLECFCETVLGELTKKYSENPNEMIKEIKLWVDHWKRYLLLEGKIFSILLIFYVNFCWFFALDCSKDIFSMKRMGWHLSRNCKISVNWIKILRISRKVSILFYKFQLKSEKSLFKIYKVIQSSWNFKWRSNFKMVGIKRKWWRLSILLKSLRSFCELVKISEWFRRGRWGRRWRRQLIRF